MDVDTASLMRYENKNKLMLIVRLVFADVDRMTDTKITKSKLYTIDSTAIILVAPVKPLESIIPIGRITFEHDLVLVPESVFEDSITRLADVRNVGGKIVATLFSGSEGIGIVTNSNKK